MQERKKKETIYILHKLILCQEMAPQDGVHLLTLFTIYNDVKFYNSKFEMTKQKILDIYPDYQ